MIDAIIGRLQNHCPTLKTVQGAVDLAGLMEHQFAVPFEKRPAAYPMFAGDQVGRNEAAAYQVVQTVTEQAVITLCVGDGSTGGSQAGKDAIVTVRDAVRDCLMGWVPEAERGALHYRGTQMLAMRPRTIWFQVSFSRQYGVSAV
jgi:hypothetical protein